ncbi:nuclear transport factor 2 family protein [Gaetbulibacter sp. M235]|uniref:YybH family protein n=1 Tax=Gaetbulibacter sp. M235 TaxID=3126510 RepID=UPI00374EA22C
MKRNLFILSFLILLGFSCQQKPNKETIESWKNEIIDAELNFCKTAEKEGMNVAFLAFVADDGILLRNDKLIKGKDNIKVYLKNSNTKGLSWKPDFVDVSSSGDLGYTYGSYTFKYKDSLGNDLENKGVFHTVWKRQQDGSWKFVWD